MPLVQVHTNTRIENKLELAQQVSKQAANILGKPESYVMVFVEDQQALVFAGSDDPAAYVELKSINLPESDTAQISSQLSEVLSQATAIDTSRIYIEFSNAQRHMWGWNGATF